ncbi:MAG: murine toxin [Sphingomonadales bacterium]|nr:murine toxin [Sphingomonadales bacterium]
MATNDYLKTNDYLVSSNQQYFVIMQSDGNLCVYEGTPEQPGNFKWGWTDCSRNQDDYFAIMQSDGNLCVYFGSGPDDNRSHLWSARTDPPGEGQYFTIMQDDGNLCVYRGAEPSMEGYVWSWMDAYSHLFEKESSIRSGLKAIWNLPNFGRS